MDVCELCEGAVMTLDPMCPQNNGDGIITTSGVGDFPCLCDLIAKVIERERDRSVKLVEAIVEAIIGSLPKPKKEDNAT